MSHLYGYIKVKDLFKNGPVGCKLLYHRPNSDYISITEVWDSGGEQYIYNLYYKGIKLCKSYDDLSLDSLMVALNMLKGIETVDSFGDRTYKPITDSRSVMLKTAGLWGA